MLDRKNENLEENLELDNEQSGGEFESEQLYDEESGEYYDEESGEYYDEESGEYYDEESGEYYDEESGEYYDEESEEYYDEESEEYYGEESEEYYDEESEEVILAGIDEEDIYEEKKVVPVVRNRASRTKKKGGFLANLSMTDKIMGGVGVLIAILAIVVVFIFVGDNITLGTTTSFAQLGAGLNGVTLIGEEGLMAVGNAEYERVNGTKPPEDTGYDEEAYDGSVIVSLNSLSIMQDLKIKFVNKTTNKLVANVPFSVAVKYPDGTLEYWEDDDKDGIVYKDEIEPGNYVVELQPLVEDTYGDYILDLSSHTIGVKDEIVYEKVDVSDEVKDESDIVVEEDDKGNVEEEEESKLENTVAFVESSKTFIGSSYTAVKKTDIADPLTLAYSGVFARLSEVDQGIGGGTPSVTYSISTETLSGIVGGSGTITVSTSDDSAVSGVTWTSDDTAIATVSGSGASCTVQYLAAGSTTVTCKVDGADVGTCVVKVTEPTVAPTVTLDKASETLEKGNTVTLTATPSDFAATPTITWASSSDTIATVDSAGTVTAKAAGEATITVTATGDGKTATATCKITVTEPAAPSLAVGKVTLSATTQTLALGDSITLKATNADFTANKELTTTWDSSDKSVVTVENGKLVAIKEGKATITVTTNYKEGASESTKATATCAVEVTAQRKIAFEYSETTGFVGTPINLKILATPAFTTSTASQYSVTTTDKAIATVAMSSDLKSVVVTPVKAGKVTVKVVYKENANAPAIETSCVINVKASDPKLDKTTVLKNKDGKELYILVDAANGKYQKAVYADYYTNDTFYVQSGDNYKYTGWTTIGKDVFYYTADGKYVTGRQVIQGAEYNFASDGTLITGSGTLGIDVSKWNGSIDWDAVKKSGVSYVIIRCGYRGYTSGSLVIDPKFKTNMEGAIAAGLKVGVYFYSQAVNEIEAVEEASMVLDLVSGYRISYPVFIDVEASGGRADSISKDMRTKVIKAFCETVENSGYTGGVYANKDWFNNKINTSQLSQYKIWLAHYTSATDYAGRYDLWQYTQSGTVSGISGHVDLNLSYLGY